MICCFTTGKLVHIVYWETSVVWTLKLRSQSTIKKKKRTKEKLPTKPNCRALCSRFLVWVIKSGGDVPRRFGLGSGYIYLKCPSLHLKNWSWQTGHFASVRLLKGMNEQSDFIVLTLELKEQKSILGAAVRHDAATTETCSFFRHRVFTKEYKTFTLIHDLVKHGLVEIFYLVPPERLMLHITLKHVG